MARKRMTVEEFLAKHGCAVAKADRGAAMLVRRYLRLQAEAKARFEEMDLLTEKLLKKVGSGQAVHLAKGQVAIVVDNYAEKNVCWRASAFRRFEVTYHEE